MKYKR